MSREINLVSHEISLTSYKEHLKKIEYKIKEPIKYREMHTFHEKVGNVNMYTRGKTPFLLGITVKTVTARKSAF